VQTHNAHATWGMHKCHMHACMPHTCGMQSASMPHACTPHTFHMHTACKLKAHDNYIVCMPHTCRMHTACTFHKCHKHAVCAPHACLCRAHERRTHSTSLVIHTPHVCDIHPAHILHAHTMPYTCHKPFLYMLHMHCILATRLTYVG
jgi:hypothetical protein